MTDDAPAGDRVFVYGTLRRDLADNAVTRAFRAGARFVADGWLPGALYAVGWYPALVETGPGHVRGEVWELTAPGLLRVLDEYEGLFAEGPPEYRRLRRDIRTAQGAMTAWTYVYADRVDPGSRIPSGDWATALSPP